MQVNLHSKENWTEPSDLLWNCKILGAQNNYDLYEKTKIL